MRDAPTSTRRRFLTIAAGSTVVGLAGCLGGDSGGDPTEEDPMGDDEMTTQSDDGMTDDGMTETDDEMTDDMMSVTFTVTIENVSEKGTITTGDGDEVAVPLSPGAYAIHDDMATAFSPGSAASAGLEALAEDGMPGGYADELAGAEHVAKTGTFTTPDGADGPAPIFPGETYSFDVKAHAGQRLSLATMFVQSNDLFYAFEPTGIPLFEDETPISGDVTDRLLLWDAGTEENQEPGAGPDQAPRQSGPDTGPAEDGPVRRIDEVDDMYQYPDTAEVLKVTVTQM
ncbi:spondin domain-containing protein [Haloarchaeobius amylolyticus]|uniref:spondin domain-containing protein n=1 Tax=Haloarchaeobius amylolyticus TaxID=1198296 RepID=UPI002270AD2A|nr:spondin domain-containing protein [Haloarchaeobius amylolyticus]